MIVNSSEFSTVDYPACDSLCLAQKDAIQSNAGLKEQLYTFFSSIFNTEDWPPRWYCGNWTDFHGWLYIISDLFIWAAYFAIPFLLFKIVNKRKDIPFPKIFWLFSAFILLCGTTHLIDAVIFWWPAYRLSALVRFLTGIVSVITVLALYKILPLIYNLRTHSELEAEIEERKKAESEAEHHQILQQAAVELMAKKDEFMSIASHELKTPITSVKASLQVINRMVDKDVAFQPMAPLVEKAVKQVDRLTSIIHELLDVTRIHSGKLDLFKTDFNLMNLISDCVTHCQPDNQYKILLEGDPDLIIHADINRLDQVISNLLTNAFKYSPVNTLVTISFKKLENNFIRVEVTDQGIGIPDDKIEHIFDRFYRVENTSLYVSGIGLGLYISSEIIKQHEGEIGVTSTFGKGSTFWFTIKN